MSPSKLRPISGSSSEYPSQAPSLANEYINIAPSPFKEDMKGSTYSESEETVTSRLASRANSITYLPPPFPPPGWDPNSSVRQPFRKRHRKLLAVLLYLLLLLLSTAAFAVPAIYFLAKGTGSKTSPEGDRDIRYHMCLWLLVSWGFFVLSNIVINVLPYAFRVIARYANPGWVKYWRIFRYMRLSVTLLGGAIGTYLAYVYVSRHLFDTGPG